MARHGHGIYWWVFLWIVCGVLGACAPLLSHPFGLKPHVHKPVFLGTHGMLTFVLCETEACRNIIVHVKTKPRTK